MFGAPRHRRIRQWRCAQNQHTALEALPNVGGLLCSITLFSTKCWFHLHVLSLIMKPALDLHGENGNFAVSRTVRQTQTRVGRFDLTRPKDGSCEIIVGQCGD